MDPWGNATQTEDLSFTVTAGPILASGLVSVGATSPVAVPRSQIGNPWLWQGQWFDYDAGLVYMRARHFDPVTGQFLQRDPLQYKDSGNLYAGMGNNALSYRDPSGANRLSEVLSFFKSIGNHITDLFGRRPKQSIASAEEAVRRMNAVESEAKDLLAGIEKRTPKTSLESEKTMITDLKKLKSQAEGDFAPFIDMEAAILKRYVGNMKFLEFAPVNPKSTEGWKLHISVSIESAHRVADIVMPILQKMDIHHKIVTYMMSLKNQMAGDQAGKFITIYTRSNEEASQIVAALERVLGEQKKAGSILPGPRPMDRQDALIKAGIPQQPEIPFGDTGFIFGMWKHYSKD